MSAHSLFLVVPLCFVITIALVMIFYKKHETGNRRRRPKEPRFAAPSSQAASRSKNIGGYDSRHNDLFLEEEVIVKKIETLAREPEISSTIMDNSMEDTMDEVEPISVIVLGLIAHPTHPYAGYELLQALLSVGLRYGKKQIFNRHEEISGRGDILFSMASAVKPGTFELNKMGSFSTPAMTLFMHPAQVKDAAKALDIMIETARQLIDDLGGEIYDDERKLLSNEKITQWRTQVQYMQQHRQTANLFDEQ